VLEEPRHVGEPFDVGDAGEVKVAAVRLRLAGERLFQVCETLGAPEALACHDSAPPLSLDGGSTAMPAARDAAAVEPGAVADDLEDDPALPREPEAPGAERSVGCEGNAVFSNHYQQADAVYPARQGLSTAGRSGASCPLPVDYPPQEDRSNGPALWAPDPRSPAEQPQERLARDPARPAHGRDRRVRLRQVVARLRHALRRAAAALH